MSRAILMRVRRRGSPHSPRPHSRAKRTRRRRQRSLPGVDQRGQEDGGHAGRRNPGKGAQSAGRTRDGPGPGAAGRAAGPAGRAAAAGPGRRRGQAGQEHADQRAAAPRRSAVRGDAADRGGHDRALRRRPAGRGALPRRAPRVRCACSRFTSPCACGRSGSAGSRPARLSRRTRPGRPARPWRGRRSRRCPAPRPCRRYR